MRAHPVLTRNLTQMWKIFHPPVIGIPPEIVLRGFADTTADKTHSREASDVMRRCDLHQNNAALETHPSESACHSTAARCGGVTRIIPTTCSRETDRFIALITRQYAFDNRSTSRAADALARYTLSGPMSRAQSSECRTAL